MISSWRDCRAYIQADYQRYRTAPWQTFVQLPQARWLLRLRLTEWWCNTHAGPLGRLLAAVLRQRLQAAGTRLGYTIPVNVVGPGLRLPHIGTIVISGDAVVGANCQILQGVTIGAHRGGAPRVGSNVFLAPNATVVGDLSIGDGARIGAGSVVTCEVPAGESWAGVPARQLLATGPVGPPGA